MKINKSLFYLVFFQFISIFGLDTTVLRSGAKIEQGERRLVIVIASYNNKDWYKQNLDSVFGQYYSNYRIIYIDDASSDGTANLVESYIKEKKMEDRVLLIKNTERQYKMANIYRAFHLCDDQDIIIEFDGDDFLSSPYAFKVYNSVYSNPMVWMTYGHFMEWPTMKPQRIRQIPLGIFKLNKMRDVTACFWAGLRTYYAWLIKQIKLEDLLYNGTFLERTSDAAIMFPLMEMAHVHAKFVGDMLLLHNVATPLNDHKADRKMQDVTYADIRKRTGYAKIKDPILKDKKTVLNKKTDLIILAQSPHNLELLLESLKLVKGIGIITVYFSVDSENITNLKQKYSQIIFKKPIKNLYSEVISTITHSQSSYLLLLKDEMKIQNPIDLHEYIQSLEYTRACGFLLNTHKNELSKSFFVEEGLYGLQLNYNQKILQTINKIYGVLLRTSYLKELFSTMNLHDEQSCERMSKMQYEKMLSQIFLVSDSASIT